MTASQEKESHMGLRDRIKLSIDGLGMSLREAAANSGISYSTLQNWTGGHREPGPDGLFALSSRLGISADWLLTGEGPMYRHDRPADEAGSLSPREQAVLALFRELEDGRQREICSAAESRLTAVEQRLDALAAALDALSRSGEK